MRALPEPASFVACNHSGDNTTHKCHHDTSVTLASRLYNPMALSTRRRRALFGSQSEDWIDTGGSPSWKQASSGRRSQQGRDHRDEYRKRNGSSRLMEGNTEQPAIPSVATPSSRTRPTIQAMRGSRCSDRRESQSTRTYWRERHFIFHIHNTEDGLMVLLDCPEERFKGALASKVSYQQDSRQISITLGPAFFTGKMTADGKALERP